MDGLATRVGAVSMRMREVLGVVLFSIAGIINVLPLASFAGSAGLQRLYGIAIGDPNLLIMLQHRAVLIGAAGVFLLLAAWRPQSQIAAAVAGLLSMGSYVVIAFTVGGYNAALQRVVVADVIAIFCVVLALICRKGDVGAAL
jgi:hypothetical protein